jgi:HlyD family secretion protein
MLSAVAGAAILTWSLVQIRRGPDLQVATADVTDGPVVRKVLTTGTLTPVRTVDVGAQVSGTIQSLEADFNSRVRAGQIVARIDPSVIDTLVTEADAAVSQGEAHVTRLREVAADARTKLERARTLATADLITRADLDAATVTFRQAEAEVKTALADVLSRRAVLRQARVNREHTVIRSPIDGVVVNRNVAVGQTVTSSFESPVLFTIADLRRMHLLAEIDEAEVSGVQPGEPVTFEIESIGGQSFEGRVAQVRLEPLVQPATASSTPTSGSAVPTGTTGSSAAPGTTSASPSSSTTASGASSSSASSQTTTTAGAIPATGAGPVAASSNATGAVSYTAVIDVQNLGERLAPGGTAIVTLVGAERAGVVRVPNNALTFRPSPDVLSATRQREPAGARAEGVTTARQSARVWKYENGRFVPIELRTGVADDRWTEVLDGEVRPGDRLVTSAAVRR